jgi:oligosaccharyl transferase complex subunit OST4
MISDDDLYRLAIFLGCAAMVLIVLYHYFEVNADENQREREAPKRKAAGKATASHATPSAKSS